MDKSLQMTFRVIGVLLVLGGIVFLIMGTDALTSSVIILGGVGAFTAAAYAGGPRGRGEPRGTS